MANSNDPLNWDALRSAPPAGPGGTAAATGAQAEAHQNNSSSGPDRLNSDNYGPGHPALYYDGKSAKGRRVRFEAQLSDALRIYDPEDRTVHLDWPAAEIIPSGALDDFPLQLRRKKDTGERLVIEDPGGRHFAGAWLGPRLAKQRRRKVRNWLMAVGAAWAFVALIWLNMNAVMNVLVGLVPESWEHELGRDSKEQIARILTFNPTGEIAWCTGAGGTAALERLSERLGMPMTVDIDAATGPAAQTDAEGQAPPPAARGEDARPVEIAVLDSKIINAFALPGRHIVVTSAMLEAAESPEELAGVLAHEMGHVTERHSTKRVLRAYGLELVFQLAAGQGDLFNAMGGLGYTLVQNKFSRADEAQADRLGVERMLAAGLDPRPLADLFERIRAEERDESGDGAAFPAWEYLSDHPSFDSRIAEIRDLAAAAEKERLAPPAPALSAQDWADLQNICAEPEAE